MKTIMSETFDERKKNSSQMKWYNWMYLFGGIFVIISHVIGQCSLQLDNNFTISCNKMCGDYIVVELRERPRNILKGSGLIGQECPQ